jgi:hypothetical protein
MTDTSFKGCLGAHQVVNLVMPIRIGTGRSEKKLSKPLLVVSANKALQIRKGDVSVQTDGMMGEQGKQAQEVVPTFIQEISPKDKPLPQGSTYRIVLGLIGVPVEESIKGQKAHSGMNHLEKDG